LTTAACGDGGATPTSSPADAAPSADLSQVEVTGEIGAKPTVTVPTPFSVPETTQRVLTKGTGPVAAAGQKVTVDYTGVNGADGKEFDSSVGEGKKSPSFLLAPGGALPGLVKGIIGQPVGSRLLLARPPAAAYGPQGVPPPGRGPPGRIPDGAAPKAVQD